MAQSLSQILLHLIFSTKDRQDLIPEELASELHAYIATICRDNGSNAYRVGGVSNHIHVACSLPRALTVSDLLKSIKSLSSSWIKRRDGRCLNFSWQTGYAAFSLGQSQLNQLICYIEKQPERHREQKYQSELRQFLDKYHVQYDEQYLWD